MLPLAVLLLALANPRLTEEQATPISTMSRVVMVDESASMDVAGRHEQAEAALAGVVDRLKRLAGLEVRVERYRPAPGRDEGTQLFHALDRALADVPRSRFAGTIMITDGEVHDVPAKPDASAPLHALIVGQHDERDRRLVIDQAPAFGIVGSTASAVVPRRGSRLRRCGDGDRSGATAARRALCPAQSNRPIELDIPLDHAGTERGRARGRGGAQRTDARQQPRRPSSINGVRDRLRVLLISGEPHAGERVWRNLLKADPCGRSGALHHPAAARKRTMRRRCASSP